jgi:sulfite dehydrogenase (cytochrome) subunit B
MKTGIIIIMVISALAVFSASVSFGQEGGTVHSITLPVVQTHLRAAAGVETVETHCSICHSLDYITMQPNFSKEKWAAIVQKMIKVMGAPVSEKDAGVIINYLAAEYGTGK